VRSDIIIFGGGSLLLMMVMLFVFFRSVRFGADIRQAHPFGTRRHFSRYVFILHEAASGHTYVIASLTTSDSNAGYYGNILTTSVMSAHCYI